MDKGVGKDGVGKSSNGSGAQHTSSSSSAGAGVTTAKQAASKGGSNVTTATVNENTSNPDQNKLDWKIFKELSGYIWPKDDRGVKIRVVTALSLLIMGKILNVQVPFFFKDIIDKLNVDFPVESTVISVVGAVILGCKFGSGIIHVDIGVHGCEL